MARVSAGVSLGRQVLRRHVNEHVRAVASQDGAVIEVLCECGRGGCLERIRIAADDYAQVRATGRLVVSAAHAAVAAARVEAPNGYVLLDGVGGV